MPKAGFSFIRFTFVRVCIVFVLLLFSFLDAILFGLN